MLPFFQVYAPPAKLQTAYLSVSWSGVVGAFSAADHAGDCSALRSSNACDMSCQAAASGLHFVLFKPRHRDPPPELQHYLMINAGVGAGAKEPEAASQ
jgi:hypothetical protein